jgi:hypothetical protein
MRIAPENPPAMTRMAMERDNQPTCGKGLAANADLPAKFAALLGARADVLERHMEALDPTDPASRQELDAYAALARTHREITGALERLAQERAAGRDLPMGLHDTAEMAHPAGQPAAFRPFVAAERELLAMLRANLAEEERLLA